MSTIDTDRKLRKSGRRIRLKSFRQRVSFSRKLLRRNYRVYDDYGDNNEDGSTTSSSDETMTEESTETVTPVFQNDIFDIPRPLSNSTSFSSSYSFTENDKRELREFFSQAKNMSQRRVLKAFVNKAKGRMITSVKNNNKKSLRVVSSLNELQSAVLNEGYRLEDIDISQIYSTEKIESSASNTMSPLLSQSASSSALIDHEVLKLIAHRYNTGSKPGHRDPSDTAKLALSIEGGGMRGSVSAGMAACIAVLGMSDAFDEIYGSSAGSVIGSYMVSRQMNIDVYTEVLPSAKSKFVSKLRLLRSLAHSILINKVEKTEEIIEAPEPAMNISFVLDGILDPLNGLRPLDMECFQHNDLQQKLKVVSSAVVNDQMETVSFSSQDMDFYDDRIRKATFNGERHGLFACLQASMTVPGATGPPVRLNRPVYRTDASESNLDSEDENCACFDAFCFEPLPYRSAVENGNTHVLVLRTRPEKCLIKTKPGFYEKQVAPLYFDQHGFPQVSKYFEQGGQQYRYLEDVLTLEEAKRSLSEKVPVPPTKILYGDANANSGPSATMVEKDKDPSTWKRAHMLPITVPSHKKELPTLENGQEDVLRAVRDGFSAAFDVLAPLVSELQNLDITGDKVAELVFPTKVLSEKEVMKQQIIFQGDYIENPSLLQQQDQEDGEYSILDDSEASSSSELLKMNKRKQIRMWLKKLLAIRRKRRTTGRRQQKSPNNIVNDEDHTHSDKEEEEDDDTTLSTTISYDPSSEDITTSLELMEDSEALYLLNCLPGIQDDKFLPILSGLRTSAGITQEDSD